VTKWGDNQAVLPVHSGKLSNKLCSTCRIIQFKRLRIFHSPLTAFILSALKYGEQKLEI